MRYRSHLLTLAHDPETPFGVVLERSVLLRRFEDMPPGEG